MKDTYSFNNLTIGQISLLAGVNDENIKYLEDELKVSLSLRGDSIQIEGDKPNLVKRILKSLADLIIQGVDISTRDINYLISLAKKDKLEQGQELYKYRIARTFSGKLIYPKTLGQKQYFSALKNNDVVFAIGPAGTGKTYLAVIFAVAALKENKVQRIILTRPAVEAGESLGFLPGDLKEKVDPYLRPLYDALYDMLGLEQAERLIEKGVIEIAPLAYMRGRTLEDAYVILDEAQNTTTNQMKMFLTRLGFNSKMIITGDITQIDLGKDVKSGLIDALEILKGTKGIEFVCLSPMDVVRHPVVQRIIERYGKAKQDT